MAGTNLAPHTLLVAAMASPLGSWCERTEQVHFSPLSQMSLGAGTHTWSHLTCFLKS